MSKPFFHMITDGVNSALALTLRSGRRFILTVGAEVELTEAEIKEIVAEVKTGAITAELKLDQFVHYRTGEIVDMAAKVVDTLEEIKGEVGEEIVDWDAERAKAAPPKSDPNAKQGNTDDPRAADDGLDKLSDEDLHERVAEAEISGLTESSTREEVIDALRAEYAKQEAALTDGDGK